MSVRQRTMIASSELIQHKAPIKKSVNQCIDRKMTVKAPALQPPTLLYLFFIGLLVTPVFASHAADKSAKPDTAPAETRWFERSFEDVLNTAIITPSRNVQKLGDTPSVISVYSAEEIHRMGIRNIKELLERTPGFFVNRQLTGSAVGSRGYISGNEQFLLLIDGHNANSIVDKGPGFYYLFPTLENVKRVEIVRGPGSTLWGSDAALGIIHVITKDGSEAEGSVLSYSNADHDDYRYAHFRTGEKLTEDVYYQFSFTVSQADGFPEDGADDFLGVGRWESIHDSSELYLSTRLRDTRVRMRFSDFKNGNPTAFEGCNPFCVNEYQAGKTGYHRRRHSYVDIERLWQLNDALDLEARFFIDRIEQWERLRNVITSPEIDYVSEAFSSKESSTGLELIGRWQASARHQLLFGWRGVRTEVDPVTNDVQYPVTSQAPSDAYASVLDLRVVPEDYDDNIALFAEDNWQILKNLSATIGLRLDNNNLRENSTIVLPRLGINWDINPQWSARYAYNTGYIRPPVGIGFLGQETFNNVELVQLSGVKVPAKLYGIDKSQEVYTHDLYLQFQQNRWITSLMLFHNRIDKAFNVSGVTDQSSDPPRQLFTVNTDQIDSYGYEMEFRFVPLAPWDVYGNFSQVLDASTDHLTGTAHGIDYNLLDGLTIFAPGGTVTSYPHRQWNLGLNYRWNIHRSVNLHYRGWNDMHIYNSSSNRDASLGSEHFVDLAIVLDQLWSSSLDLTIFAKNLLDNDDSEISLIVWRNTWSERGRSIGAKLTYHF